MSIVNDQIAYDFLMRAIVVDARLDDMSFIVISFTHRMRCVRRHESSDKSSPAPTARREPVAHTF